MLITINISFCLLSMPMSILQIFYYNNPSNLALDSKAMASKEEKEHSESLLDIIDLLHAIAEFLQFVNHSSNFFLYSLSGKTFRNQTKRFIINKFILVKKFLKNN